MDLYIFYCFAIIQLSVCVSTSEPILKSIHVVFRHGDRTPDAYPLESYPTDPYKNNPFYPTGNGGLTNKGKLRLFKFGISLRQRYNKFLSDFYWPPDIKVISTYKSRTKMSLQMVLAAMYPPKDEQIWMKDFNWQPIPINFLSPSDDPYFITWKCPVYNAEFERVRNTQKYQEELSEFNKLLQDLTYFTGREVINTEFIYYLYHTLTAQSYMGLTVPEWTKPYYPNGVIINATLLEYDVMSYNAKLRRLNGGMTLRKILDDISIVLDETVATKAKVHLYSAHDVNIAGLLQSLNLWKKDIPEYTSSVIFELYEENLKYFIKVIHFKGIPVEYEEQQIPGCIKMCPYDNFLRLTKDVVPVNVIQECFGSKYETYKSSKSYKSSFFKV